MSTREGHLKPSRRLLLLCVLLLAAAGARGEPLRHVPAPNQPPDSRLLPESLRTPPAPQLVPPRPASSGRTKWTGGLHPAELGVLAGIVTLDLFMYGFREQLSQQRNKPRIEDPGPNDLDTLVSNAVYSPGRQALHGRFPDYLGSIIAPTAGIIFYGANALTYWIRGRSLINSSTDEDPYPAQPARLLWAACEVAAYSTLFQQIANSAIERARPSLGLKRPDFVDDGSGQVRMSFYSGHVSTAFGMAAFISLNLGDFLTQQPLRNMHPAPRFLIGRVLPTVTLYGLASYVGVSRLYDQLHYFSDIAIGAVAGTAIGNIIYLTHFSASPKGSPFRGRIVPMGHGGIAYVGTF
jgi:membrane-associated phospholipid phosphatase